MSVVRFVLSLAVMPAVLTSCVLPGQDQFPGPGDDLPVVITRDSTETSFSIALCPDDDYAQYLGVLADSDAVTAIWSVETVVKSTEMRMISITFDQDQVIEASMLAVEGLQPSESGTLTGADVTDVSATTYRGEAGFELDAWVPVDGNTYLVRGNPAAGGSVERLQGTAESIFAMWCNPTTEEVSP